MTGLAANDIVSWAKFASAAPERAWSLAIETAQSITESHAAFITVATMSGAPVPGDGVLAGVPVAVKDNIETVELPTSYGAPLLAGSIPVADAPAVRLLRAAGSGMVGKTNLHELALGVTSDNGAFGAVVNPVDAARSAGGSSGGSAVAVALGAAPYALGTDTGGSMTIPAAYCGVVGYRPSPGRYPGAGVANLSSTRDTIGIMTTGVADLREVDRIIRQVREIRSTPRELRLAVCTDYLQALDGSVQDAFDTALSLLTDQGIRLGALQLPTAVGDARVLAGVVVGYEAPIGLAAALARLGDPVCTLTVADLAARAGSADVGLLLQGFLDHPVAENDYRRALQLRAVARWEMDRVLDGRFDAILYPTCPTEPPLLHRAEVVTADGRTAPAFPTLIRHTEAGSMLGAPSVTLPIAAGGELPVGLTLEGAPGDDDRLLAVAELTEGLLATSANGRPR